MFVQYPNRTCLAILTKFFNAHCTLRIISYNPYFYPRSVEN